MEKSFLRLKNKEGRDAYVEAEFANGLATQIRLMRQDRCWSQEALANKLGTSQNVVSRLEDPSYGKYTVKTLLSLARIFDVALFTRFVPFSQFLPMTWDTKSSHLLPTSFDEEIEIIRFDDAPTFQTIHISNNESPSYLSGHTEVQTPITIFYKTI